MYYYCYTCYLCSQAHKRKNYLLFSRWHMLFNTFANMQASIQLWLKSTFILQRSLQRSRSHKRSCVHFPSFVRNQGRGHSQVLRQAHAETAICNEAGFPKEQVSSSRSLQLLYPKRDIKTRQLLPLSTPSLWVPLNLMAGPSTSVCYMATFKAARPLAQWSQDSYLETEIQQVLCHLSHLQTRVKAVSYTWENGLKQL